MSIIPVSTESLIRAAGRYRTRHDAARVKAGIQPMAFYLDALPSMKPPRRFGWADGGLCPFHTDGRPGSFRVNTETGAFACFSCGAKGGDIIAFTMLRDGLDFPAAIKRLADDWGV